MVAEVQVEQKPRHLGGEQRAPSARPTNFIALHRPYPQTTPKEVGMSQEEKDTQKAPRLGITEGGKVTWPVEPKVTKPEEMLYGDQAQVVRLLGQAADAASDAYLIACKRRQVWDDVEVADRRGVYALQPEHADAMLQAAWDAYAAAHNAYTDAAAEALSHRRKQAEMCEAPIVVLDAAPSS